MDAAASRGDGTRSERFLMISKVTCTALNEEIMKMAASTHYGVPVEEDACFPSGVFVSCCRRGGHAWSRSVLVLECVRAGCAVHYARCLIVLYRGVGRVPLFYTRYLQSLVFVS